MAELNPPGFLQNAGATHTAEQMRNWFGNISTAVVSNLSLIPDGGVHYPRGNRLSVTQTGSPSMAVIIKSGAAFIPGTEGSKQGFYAVTNDNDVTLAITAAHATLNRIDIVVYKVQDTAYSGGVNTSSLAVVTGTPAASPAAPSAPANSIILAQVAVNAAVTSIVNSNITDTREYFTAAGGIMPIRSSGQRPPAGTVAPGHMNFNIGSGKYEFTVDGGTSWADGMPLYKARSTLGGTAASVSFTGIPSNLRELRVTYSARTNAAVAVQGIRITFNGVVTANYHSEQNQANNATVIGANSAGLTSGISGLLAGNNAAAGIFATGEIFIPGWDSPRAGFLNWLWTSGFLDTGSTYYYNAGAGMFTPAGPYNRLDLIPDSGSFVAGSDFNLIGVYA